MNDNSDTRELTLSTLSRIGVDNASSITEIRRISNDMVTVDYSLSTGGRADVGIHVFDLIESLYKEIQELKTTLDGMKG